MFLGVRRRKAGRWVRILNRKADDQNTLALNSPGKMTNESG
jgi:hypothetical protein